VAEKLGKTKKKATLRIPITAAAHHTQHALGLIQEMLKLKW